MSFFARNNPEKGDNYRSSSLLYEDDNANQHEEYQSTSSELPAEIPDSQPDPYLPAEIPDSQPYSYLPAEIPDSQADIVYHAALPFGPFESGDYELGEDEAVDHGDRLNRFEQRHREEVDESVKSEALYSSSSGDTVIITGGTRLTERIVGFFRHSPILSSLVPNCFESSRPQQMLNCDVTYSSFLAIYVRSIYEYC